MRSMNGDAKPDKLEKLLAQVVDNRIRARAYELYLQRAKAEGHALDDWLSSESELWARTRKGTKATTA